MQNRKCPISVAVVRPQQTVEWEWPRAAHASAGSPGPGSRCARCPRSAGFGGSIGDDSNDYPEGMEGKAASPGDPEVFVLPDRLSLNGGKGALRDPIDASSAVYEDKDAAFRV